MKSIGREAFPRQFESCITFIVAKGDANRITELLKGSGLKDHDFIVEEASSEVE